MNLLADEGIDRQIVALLREGGYDVLYIADAFTVISPGMVRIRKK